MSTTIISRNPKSVTIAIDIPLEGSMMQIEEAIQDSLNDAGRLAIADAPERFDTDGSPIVMGNAKLHARSTKIDQRYETPYGKINVARYLYQTISGGATYCPMEDAARCVLNSTCRFAVATEIAISLTEYAIGFDRGPVRDVCRRSDTERRRRIPRFAAGASSRRQSRIDRRDRPR